MRDEMDRHAGRMKEIVRRIIPFLLVPAVTAAFLSAVDRLDEGQADKSKEQLSRALHRAIAAEYVATGAYPESLDGILEKYGVRLDRDRYDVFYMPVAENLAPSLDIIDKSEQRGGGF